MKSDSRSISKAIGVYRMSEPTPKHAKGIYIGKTMVYKAPFYLDSSSLLNPHMAIIGMSGSGKSYMLKSFVAKSVVHNGARMLTIDWNDEYREFIEFLSGRILSFGKDFKINVMDVYLGSLGGISNIIELIDSMVELDQTQKSELHTILISLTSSKEAKNLKSLISIGSQNKVLLDKLSQLQGNPFFADTTGFDIRTMLDGVYSINLATLRDNSQRAELVRFILRLVIDCMHRMEISSKKQRILVLDESWRLLRNSEEVSILYREGRKYGISVVSATQMVSDINNEIMANAGCLAVFRLQNGRDYEVLESVGLSNLKLRDTLSSLGIGSCLICLAAKEGSMEQSRFYLQKVSGIEFGRLNIIGINMKHEMSYRKFLELTSLFGGPLKEKIAEFAIQHGKRIEVVPFVGFLTELGMSRGTVVSYLRELGLDDLTIVNSYELA
jgi:DNA helicase HerA-like ATPase